MVDNSDRRDTGVMPVVLVHGGSFGKSCWDLLVDHLRGPVLAVDLPGRGAHPAPLRSVTIASAAASVVADVDAAGFDDVVLVGHSLAGCSMPATETALRPRPGAWARRQIETFSYSV